MRVKIKLHGNPAVVEVSRVFMEDSYTLGVIEQLNSGEYYVVDVGYNDKLHETLDLLLEKGCADLSMYIAEKRFTISL